MEWCLAVLGRGIQVTCCFDQKIQGVFHLTGLAQSIKGGGKEGRKVKRDRTVIIAGIGISPLLEKPGDRLGIKFCGRNMKRRSAHRSRGIDIDTPGQQCHCHLLLVEGHGFSQRGAAVGFTRLQINSFLIEQKKSHFGLAGLNRIHQGGAILRTARVDVRTGGQ